MVVHTVAGNVMVRGLTAIVAGALLALHIGNGGPLNGTAALETASPPSQVRPGGWSPATHGNQARPDYARLFALDRVHDLRISIDAATFRAMREDLTSVVPFGGILSGRAGAPPAPSGAACGGPFGKGGGLTSRAKLSANRPEDIDSMSAFEAAMPTPLIASRSAHSHNFHIWPECLRMLRSNIVDQESCLNGVPL